VHKKLVVVALMPLNVQIFQNTKIFASKGSKSPTPPNGLLVITSHSNLCSPFAADQPHLIIISVYY
jgi:hypothetical protein